MQIIIRAVAGKREEFCAYLAERLPDAAWCWDRSGSGLENQVTALRLQGAEPAVHLEDDVILTRDFRAKLEAAVAPWPEEIVNLFSIGTERRTRDDLALGSRWEAGRRFMGTQCFYASARDAERLVEFYSTWLGRPGYVRQATFDHAIGDYLAASKRRYRVHVPSLVQHRPGQSLLGHQGFQWTSPTFADPWL